MQIRNGLNKDNLARIRAAYRSGADVPPILVAFIEGGSSFPVVVDGHHRFAVLEALQAHGTKADDKPVKAIRAKLIRLTKEQARYQAAIANNTHGQPLTREEGKRLFRAYMGANQYLGADGEPKSYRQIGREMGRDHKTISKWMNAEYKAIAVMIGDQEPTTEGRDGPPPTPGTLVTHTIDAQLLKLRELFEDGYSAERNHVIAGMESLLAQFKEAQGQTTAWMHDDEKRHSEVVSPSPDKPF